MFNLMAPLPQVRRLRAKEMEPIHLLSLEQKHSSIRFRRLNFTGSRAPRRASEESSLDHFRRNLFFSSSGCPDSQHPPSIPLLRRGRDWGTWNAECMWEFGSSGRHTCLHSLSTWHVRPGQIKLPWERPWASPQMHWCGSSQGRQDAIAE